MLVGSGNLTIRVLEFFCIAYLLKFDQVLKACVQSKILILLFGSAGVSWWSEDSGAAAIPVSQLLAVL